MKRCQMTGNVIQKGTKYEELKKEQVIKIKPKYCL